MNGKKPGGLGRRLEALEARLKQASGSAHSTARPRMVAHLARVAAIRRGAEVSDEERAEIAKIEEAVRRRLKGREGTM